MDTGNVNFLNLFDIADRQEMRQTHEEIESLIMLMGGNSKAYRRERRQQSRAIVAEIYSAPRVTRMAARRTKYGLEPGLALDLSVLDENSEPWDFDIKEKRDKAELLLDQQRPLLLVGSPMCTAFSRLLALSESKRDPVVVARLYTQAMVHLEFVCRLYRKQRERGLYFLHGHPATAKSWDEKCIL